MPTFHCSAVMLRVPAAVVHCPVCGACACPRHAAPARVVPHVPGRSTPFERETTGDPPLEPLWQPVIIAGSEDL